MGKIKKLIIVLAIIIAILVIINYITEDKGEDSEIRVKSNGTWALTVTVDNETKEYTGTGNETIVLGKVKEDNVYFYIKSEKEGTTAKGTLYQNGAYVTSDTDTYVVISSNKDYDSTNEYSQSSSSNSKDSYYTDSYSSSGARCWCGQIH